MHEGWLGRDPSTALDDGDFAIAAKMSAWLCVCVCVCVCMRVCVCIICLLRSIRQPEGGWIKENSLGKIKGAAVPTVRKISVFGTLQNYRIKTPANCFTCQRFVTELRQQRAVVYHTLQHQKEDDDWAEDQPLTCCHIQYLMNLLSFPC